MLESILADVRFALRWLRRSPGFTAVAVASFAIGIGFNTALFSAVDTLLLRPLPVAHADRLVDVYTTSPTLAANGHAGTSSYQDYLDLRAHNEVFEDLIGYSPLIAALSLGDHSERVIGEIVTGNYFRSFGIAAAVGRTLAPEDDVPGSRVAMISYEYWTRELGGRQDIVGRTLKLRGHPYTIVGVVRRGFSGMTSVLTPDLWVPAAASLDVEPVGLRDRIPSAVGTRLDQRGDRWLFMKGRLKPGVTVDRVRANLDVIMTQLEVANPVTNKDRRIAVRAAHPGVFGLAADPFVTLSTGHAEQMVSAAVGLMLAVGLVLLIGCANVASMLLARSAARRREIGVRLAIGASRGRLVRQLLTESVVLSMLGAAAGIALAWWIVRALRAVRFPSLIPYAIDPRVDTRVLGFTLAATIAAGLLAGLAPALKASSPSLASDVRGESPISRLGGRRWSARDLLVTAQMAVTVLLLVMGALLTRGLIAAQHARVGFAADRLAFVVVETSMLGYSPQRSLQFYDQALARVRAIPGVDSAALTIRPPFSPNYNRWNIWIPGRNGPGEPGDEIDVARISTEYFETMGVPILEGRNFTSADRPDTQRVAIVNEVMARKYWPGESAVGKTLRTRGSAGPLYIVVGVIANHKVNGVGEGPTPFMHVARDQQPSPYSAIVAHTRGDPVALLRDMRRELLAMEPNLVFFESQTMSGEVDATLFPARASAWLVGISAAMAMLLASIGLYGVIAYSVARRTREMGIRFALGARRSGVLGLVMKQGLVVAGAGLIPGYAVALYAAGAIAGWLYGVSPTDPLSWTTAGLVLLAVAAAANLVPAWRAARINPSEALRVE